jgi:hypothetical protein
MPEITFIRDDAGLHLRHARLALPEAYRLKVDAYWQGINRDGRFFNGQVLAATRIDILGSTASIELALTDYAHYLYAARHRTQEFSCPAVYGAVVILTADRHLLLGQMGGHTSSPGQIQCPGGGIEISADQTLDARACCRRELEEEIGAAFWDDRLWFRPLCVKAGGDLSTIGLFYALKIKATAQQAMAIFERHQSRLRSAGQTPEFDRLHAVKFEASAMRDFMETRKDKAVDYLAPLFLDRMDAVIAALEQPEL